MGLNRTLIKKIQENKHIPGVHYCDEMREHINGLKQSFKVHFRNEIISVITYDNIGVKACLLTSNVFPGKASRQCHSGIEIISAYESKYWGITPRLGIHI